MHTSEHEHIRSIKSFPSLLKYLRDELEWPIDSDEVEDITFEYEPEELGLDAKTAVKIKEIKQLRPLTTHQPWGIFFINFEPKRLPVVVLRRILRTLVIKKRATVKQAHQKTWQLHDLMFISSYGEQEHRNITFAHFYEEKEYGDLPTLHVLGWDDEDTALHLEHAHQTLKEKLRWPEDETNIDAWRSSWAMAFTLRHREVITTSKELSIRLAELARAIRKRTNAILKVESERGPLRRLQAAFKESLIHDLSEDDFADMHAQTISYGLLTARVSRPGGLVADNIAEMVPVTNPFLKELLETFLHVGGRKSEMDFDELGINDVVDLLRRANMEAILRDFGNRNPNEDPVIHFYELFLKEYDAKKRMQRGVFFTPLPVVSYIVRSVHELLQTEFGLEDGLASIVTWGEMKSKLPLLAGEGRGEVASPPNEGGDVRRTEGVAITIPAGVSPDDPFVLILDIASGTGTFMVMVIDVIYNTMMTKWERQGHGEAERKRLWNDYVPEHLLPRLFGYELMMAPYAIAHMKIGLRLYETGYRFRSSERVHLYLTNTLEPPQDFSDRLAFDVPALAHEALAVNAVKRSKRFTVVIGNPPYAKLSCNRNEDAEVLVDPFKLPVRGERNIQPLSDDYIKFFGFMLSLGRKVPAFSFGMITNRGYLDGLIHRGIRQVFHENFSKLWTIDLHGDSKVGETTPEGLANENVFDIQQGVAITVGVNSNVFPRAYKRMDSWGTRAEKYTFLSEAQFNHSQWKLCVLSSPNFFFQQARSSGALVEYEKFIPLTTVMPSTSTGIKTHRDDLVLDFTKNSLILKIRNFVSPERTDSEVRNSFFGTEKKGRLESGDNSEWSMSAARRRLQKEKMPLTDFVRRITYRPFDERFIFYNTSVIDRAREDFMSHMDGGENLGLITTRQVPNCDFSHVLATHCYVEMKTASHDRGTNLFPIFLKPESGHLDLDKTLRPNLGEFFLKVLPLSLRLNREEPYGLPQGLTPEDIFNYIYAVFHSPTYRTRYAEFLKIDFPRVPLTSSLELFHALAKLGGDLVALHLMESPTLDEHITKFITPSPQPSPKGRGSDTVIEKVTYSNNTVWIDKAQTSGFAGVPENVWEFHIGGYQVCNKWLKDRKGRTLTKEDVEHYHRIVVALSETIRIMKEIDEVIERHGGFPLVGSTDPIQEAKEEEQTEISFNATAGEEEIKMEAAESDDEIENEETIEEEESEEATLARAYNNIDEVEYEEIICTIRQVFTEQRELDRDAAIREVSHALGFQRTGDRIYEVINGAMIAAAKRSIIVTEYGVSQLYARSIHDYTIDELIAVLRTVVGRVWTTRADAYRGVARYLGFRRTGKNIESAIKSAINGGIRRGALESGGEVIRAD